MTKYHRLGGLNNRHLFLTVLEDGSPRSRWQQIGFPMWAYFLVPRHPSSDCVLTCLGERENSGLSSSSYKNTNPVMGAPSSWPHLNLIISQRPHLPIPTQWGLGLQHINLEGTYSVHNKRCPHYLPPNEPWQGLEKCCKKDQIGRESENTGFAIKRPLIVGA